MAKQDTHQQGFAVEVPRPEPATDPLVHKPSKESGSQLLERADRDRAPAPRSVRSTLIRTVRSTSPRARRWRMPCEKPLTRTLATSSSPTRSSAAPTRSVDAPYRAQTKRRFSAAVRSA